MFNGMQFFEDFDIQYEISGKNISSNWIGINCPRCAPDYSAHLGFNPESGAFKCWRCGKMSAKEAIHLLTKKPYPQVNLIFKKYSTSTKEKIYVPTKRVNDIEVVFPIGTLKKFPKTHVCYLHQRKFDAHKIINEWNLKATGALGPYKQRIIAPIYENQVLVSYQGRDITDKSKLRYKACKTENERVHHKHTLYGIDCAKKNSILVVEGITDVWRLGYGSVATFGTSYTQNQVAILRKFKNVFILFDNEDTAQKKAYELCHEIAIKGNHVEVIQYDKDTDPGGLSEQDAKYLMCELLLV